MDSDEFVVDALSNLGETQGSIPNDIQIDQRVSNLSFFQILAK